MGKPARWAIETKLTIDCLADDLAALLDHLEIEQAVVGGISLGSAVAVNAALRYPERVLGPWFFRGRPGSIGRCRRTCDCIRMIAELIRSVGAREGLERFRRTAEFQAMERESPDCAKSLDRPVRAAASRGMRRSAGSVDRRNAVP